MAEFPQIVVMHREMQIFAVIIDTNGASMPADAR